MRVIFFTQKLDESDWLLGFTVAWLRALAVRVDHVDVVALEQRSAELPANVDVYSLGKEHGAGRLAEAIAFQRIVAGRARHTDVIFGHLTARYTWLAAPWAILNRVPQCLWYTHRQIDRDLRLALPIVRWVTTAAADSFPIASSKVHIMGHGIDALRYAPNGTTPDRDPPLIMAVGRIAPIKRHAVLIDAAAILKARGVAVQIVIAGGATSPEGMAYQASLQAQIARLDLGASVTLLGALPADALIGWYRRATIVTNLSPPGLFDKAALEAAFIARPIVVTNPAFNDLLGDDRARLSLPDPPDPAVLADRLQTLLALSEAERAHIGDQLRERAMAQHSLDRLMDRLVALWKQ